MAAIRPSSCYAADAPPITDAHVAALEADDYVVIDGLFPRVDELRQALDDAEYRKTMQSESIRTDRVRWVTEEDGVVGDTVRALKGLGDRFAPAVGYECVDAPSKCMVARYEQGGYRTHLDHDPPADDDLYWLWKSSREQSGRVLTAILYLTDPDFDACLHGGCLRLFLGCTDGDASGETATSIRDVEPFPGRLVVFKSRRVPHAVLDTSRRRLALSCWHLAPEASAVATAPLRTTAGRYATDAHAVQNVTS